MKDLQSLHCQIGVYSYMHMYFVPQVLNQTFEFFVHMHMDFAVLRFTFLDIK